MKRTQSSVARLAHAFWSGATERHGGTAVAAIGLTLLGFLALAAASTESHVASTDVSHWLHTPEDEYGHLTAVTLQGAARHARGPGETVVFVGASMLYAILPPGLDQRLSSSFRRPVRALQLWAGRLSSFEAAAVVDRFGGDFDGWFVIGVNRHSLAFDLRQQQAVKDATGANVGFSSPVLVDELARAGLRTPDRWHVPILDHPGFYIGALGGFRHMLTSPPVFHAEDVVFQKLTPSMISTQIPQAAPTALDTNLQALGRLADRLRQNHARAQLLIVECPFADEVSTELHDADWRAARDKFIEQRDRWSGEHRVAWLDPLAQLSLRIDDFADVRHIGSSTARVAFADAVARRLAAVHP